MMRAVPVVLSGDMASSPLSHWTVRLEFVGAGKVTPRAKSPLEPLSVPSAL